MRWPRHLVGEPLLDLDDRIIQGLPRLDDSRLLAGPRTDLAASGPPCEVPVRLGVIDTIDVTHDPDLALQVVPHESQAGPAGGVVTIRNAVKLAGKES